MTSITVNIIGAGRLGKTVGKLLTLKANARILAICNRSPQSGQEAVDFIGQGKLYGSISELPSADFVLISTADEQITECMEALKNSPNLQEGTVVAHCGGALSSEILAPLRERGCTIASFHPMHSFANPALSVQHFAGTFCALEGDQAAVAFLDGLLTSLGAIVSQIDPAKKALYHAGGVMASNYLVTLFDKAVSCLEASGATRDVAQKIVFSLMQGSLHNLGEAGSAPAALTGPIKRGEAEIVGLHLAAMPNQATSSMYRALGLATLDIAGLPREKEAAIRNTLMAD